MKQVTPILLIVISMVTLAGVRFIPKAGKYSQLWLFCCILNILVAFFFFQQNYKKSKTIEKLECDVYGLKEYSDIANLTTTGAPFGESGSIEFISPLTRMLKETYTKIDNRVYFHEEPEYEQKYRTIIQQFPKFPFAYYGLVLCLRRRGDQSWRYYAEEAVKILKITTTISGHKGDHDQALEKLLIFLAD